MSPGEARGYSWPPFRAGHALSLRHGAFSERVLSPRAASVLAAAIEAAPWLGAPEYEPALSAWSRAEARCALISEWLDEQGVLDDDGRPRPAVDALLRFERLATDLRGRLGLDPRSRAKLERDLSLTRRMTVDTEAELREGRRLRLAAESREAEQ